jgi:CRISPR system Cascade subunit CasC
LANDEETGAAGIFDAELTSAVYYGYIVVDVPGLVSNTVGIDRADWTAAGTDRRLAGEVVYRLAHLLATVSLGAKKGSTAPYAYAESMLAEVGSRQPRTLANAFLKPVPLRNDPAAEADARLLHELNAIDRNFGTHESRRRMTKHDASDVDIPRATLAELAAFARDAVVAGAV